MAFTRIPSVMVPHGYIGPTAAPSTFDDAIDATGEKVAFIGRVYVPGSGSVDITRIGFRFGAVTKAGGSGLTVSLQNVSSAAGQPMRPDETQDQTVAVANGDAGFTSNAWYRTGALSANRTVSHGDLLAVVVEYDGSGRLGADSVVVQSIDRASTNFEGMTESVVYKLAGSWGQVAAIPNVVLEDTSGDFHTLQGTYPISTISSILIDSDPADEVGLEFVPPVPMRVNGMWAQIRQDATDADAVFVLYDDAGTSLRTFTNIGFHTPTISGFKTLLMPFAELDLVARATYRIGMTAPSSANDVRLTTITVDDAGHLDTWPFGQTWRYTARVGAGSWTPVATQRPFIGLIQCGEWDAPAQLVNNAGLVG